MTTSPFKKQKSFLIFIYAMLMISIMVVVEWKMGRPFFCACGEVKFWMGDIFSNQTSQQFSDPYTFSHILHGVLFYFLIWLIFKNRFVFGQSLLIAIFLECGWEILENSSFIIDRYREGTISLGYYGDSILNSISDVLAMIFGFILAKKISWGKNFLIFLVIELLLLFLIRDNLTLNIIMLIHPIEFIKIWQLGT